jgi:hypothetical protein
VTEITKAGDINPCLCFWVKQPAGAPIR